MQKFFGNIFVITAPSGAGKSSLVQAILKKYPSISASISCTTRVPRPGEADGKDYHYISVHDFKTMRDNKMLLEWAVVHGHFYGTPKNLVDRVISNGSDILLEIDWQGTQQIKKYYPEAYTIFLAPPSIEELKNRLVERAQDNLFVIARRLHAASEELSHAADCSYVIVNEHFNTALSELSQIINVARLKFSNQLARNKDLFSKLGIIS